MTKERQKFLAKRLQAASEQQPEILDLRRLLISFGGIELVAPPSFDSAVPSLISAGKLMLGSVFEYIMKTSSCHRNVASIWSGRRNELVGIGTGYALSADKLWRKHSWGVRTNDILETTNVREKYFGLLLKAQDADVFALANMD